MLSFNSIDELQDCDELRSMGRYQHCEVMLEGRKVIACTTNQQYEDIIWGALNEMFEELASEYDNDKLQNFACDLSSEVRDIVLEKLEKTCGIEFVDVFNEY